MSKKAKYYAGIGSRETPDNVLEVMIDIGRKLAEQGYILRSGGAEGADCAFEEGCDAAGGDKEIFIPWRGFNNKQHAPVKVSVAALKIAKELHPAWNKCNEWAQLLHGRNVYQVLGQNLKSPVEFVVCWTEKGKTVGGTSTAIRLAEKHGIVVYNLGHKKGIDAFSENVFPIKLDLDDCFDYVF